MSLMSQFEKRMMQIYEPSAHGAPLAFSKVAKSACKELKREAMRVNGVDTSPNLVTILINPCDEDEIRPYYEQTTTELSYCLSQYARDHKLAVPNDPLVRFISSSVLKPGKFFCCAQMAPYPILTQLKQEENALSQAMPYARAKRLNSLDMLDDQPHIISPAFDAAQVLPVLEGVPDLPAPPTPIAPPVAGLSTANNVSLGGKNYQAHRFSQEPAQYALTEDRSGKRHQLHDDSYILGRDRSVSSITFKDSNVSRAHAKLYRDGDTFVIEDLNSTNGVCVNGTRIHEPFVLQLNDEIILGATTLYFERG